MVLTIIRCTSFSFINSVIKKLKTIILKSDLSSLFFIKNFNCGVNFMFLEVKYSITKIIPVWVFDIFSILWGLESIFGIFTMFVFVIPVQNTTLA